MRTRTAALLAVVGGVVMPLGCQDALAPGDYLGTPRIEIRGTIKGDSGYGAMLINPRMGVLWGQPESLFGNATTNAAGNLTSAVSTKFPTQFELALYDVPEQAPGVVGNPGGVAEARVGFGRLVVIDDVDGNGRFAINGGTLTAPDRLVGAATKHLVVYADDVELPGPALRRLIANPERLTRGYQVARGLCGQDGEADRLELVDASAAITIELVNPSSTVPAPTGCLRLAP